MDGANTLRNLVAIRHFVADNRLGADCLEEVDRTIAVAVCEDREAIIAALSKLENALIHEFGKALDERSEPTKLGLAIEEEILRAVALWTELVHPDQLPYVNKPLPYRPWPRDLWRHRRRRPGGGESSG